MEAIVTIVFIKFLQSCDWQAFVIFYRISVTCKHDTHCCIVFELKVDLIQCSINAGFHDFNNIILHSWKYDLSLRISKSGIILQYFRSVWCQHESEENNSFEWAAFCFHGIDCCLIYIFVAEIFNFLCIKWTW